MTFPCFPVLCFPRTRFGPAFFPVLHFPPPYFSWSRVFHSCVFSVPAITVSFYETTHKHNSITGVILIIQSFSDFINNSEFLQLHVGLVFLVLCPALLCDGFIMGMTHDRQKSADIVGRHHRPTKIGRVPDGR